VRTSFRLVGWWYGAAIERRDGVVQAGAGGEAGSGQAAASPSCVLAVSFVFHFLVGLLDLL
jgi:hypothetical protein